MSANTVELDEYVLVDLRASYRALRAAWSCTAGWRTCSTKQYETTRRYGTPGRGVYAGFRVEF